MHIFWFEEGPGSDAELNECSKKKKVFWYALLSAPSSQLYVECKTTICTLIRDSNCFRVRGGRGHRSSDPVVI
jgi:hypothetical protein